MTRFAALLLLASALACAGGANLRAPGVFLVHGASVDRVWGATLEALRERGWSPTDVRQSPGLGVVVTDWFAVGSHGEEFMDCGDPERRVPARGRVEVRVRPEPDGVAVDIRSHWRGRVHTGDEADACFTRGVAEDQLREAILSLVRME
ncbi:MAG: hypothetical protein RLN75_06240 [Longimicrobiales bacterium]